MKTFKSALNSPVTLEVEESTLRQGFYLTIGQNTILIAPSDAPALMQAIVECLPPLPDFVRDGSYEAYMAVVVEYLDRAVRALEYETAKAKEQAELEAEALELYNARISFLGGEALTSFEELNQANKDIWIVVARKARELGGRTKK